MHELLTAHPEDGAWVRMGTYTHTYHKKISGDIQVLAISDDESAPMEGDAKMASKWITKLKHAVGRRLSLTYNGECTATEVATLPDWNTIQCRGAGTGLRVCNDHYFAISIDSQSAYPVGGIPKAYCHIDISLSEDKNAKSIDNKIKLPQSCYPFHNCIVCNPPNVAEGCGAGYTNSDVRAWEKEEARIFGWERVREIEGK